MTEPPASTQRLTHVDASGAAHMVDIGGKAITRRQASAQAVCVMNLQTAQAVQQNALKKGDVLQVARLAAILAAKRTDELIPLCHTIPLESVEVEFAWLDDHRLHICTTAVTTGRTGVEMEAMVAASTAALTVYDMCKSSDRAMRIEGLELLSKSGGKSGEYKRMKDEG